MNKNLATLLDILIKNQKLLEKFLAQDNAENLYDFCISIVDGYTFEEFKKFLEILAKNDYDLEDPQKISDENLENVAGGFGMPTRMAAAWMGGMLLLGSGGVSAHGLSNNNDNNNMNTPSYSNSISVKKNINNNYINELNQKFSNSNSNSLKEQKNNLKKIANAAQKFTNSKNENSNIRSSTIKNSSRNNLNENLELSIVKSPAASSIHYGQKLSESTLSGGKANVGGSFSWVNPSIAPTAGQKTFKVKFTPNDNNLKPKIIDVSVNIAKAKPVISSWPSSAQVVGKYVVQHTYFSGGKTNIGGRFSWSNKLSNINNGQQEQMVTFTPNDTDNYETVSQKVRLNISNLNVSISWPTASEITYGQRLSESKLSNGLSNIAGRFEWDTASKDSFPEAGTQSYKIVFKPYDTQKYGEFSQYIKVKVNQATPRLEYKPSASRIVYGQSLAQSELTNGKCNIKGSFSWESSVIRPRAGITLQKAIFTPNDTKNYKSTSVNVLVNVKKAPTQFMSTPSVSDITYGESLSSSHISNISTNVSGEVYWENGDDIPEAGTHTRTIVFKPYDSNNYEKTKIKTQIRVKKAAVKLTQTSLDTAYKEGMVISDLKLPKGWMWDVPNTRLNKIGQFQVGVTYPGDQNHLPSKTTVTVTVNKAEPKLSLPKITYSENKRLKDIPLPRGWHWNNENETPTANKTTYKASFNANEAGTNFYHSRSEVDVSMNVRKAEPQVFSWAKPESEITYGDNLSDVKLKGGNAGTKGSFKLLGSTYDMGAGDHKCKIVFTPSNANYKEVISEIQIKILKNMTPAEAPEQISASKVKRTDTTISFDIKQGVDPIEFSKDGGKTWQNSPTFKNLSPNTIFAFVQRYKDTKSRCAGKISKALKIATKDSAPESPGMPNLIDYTNHSIILKSVPELEFSKDGGKTWQDSGEFRNLKSKKEYKIVSRIKENEMHVAGKISNPLVVTTRSWLGNLWHSIVS